MNGMFSNTSNFNYTDKKFNFATNKMSEKMRYADYIRRNSKATIDNSVSGGITNNSGIFFNLAERCDKCLIYLDDLIIIEEVIVDTQSYPPYSGPPDLNANFYNALYEYPIFDVGPPNLNADFYDPKVHTFPNFVMGVPDLSLNYYDPNVHTFPEFVMGVPNLDLDYYDPNIHTFPEFIMGVPDLKLDYYDPNIHTFPEFVMSVPDLNLDYYDANIHTFPPNGVAQPDFTLDFYDENVHTFPPNGVAQPDFTLDFYDENVHTFPPHGVAQPDLTLDFYDENVHTFPPDGVAQPDFTLDFYDPNLHTFPPNEVSFPDITKYYSNPLHIYPPEVGAPDLTENFYDEVIHTFPPHGLAQPDLTKTYDETYSYPPIYVGPPDLNKTFDENAEFPEVNLGPPDITISTYDASYSYPPEGINQPPNLNDDFYDPQVHTFPPKEISQPPNINDDFYDASYSYPPEGINQPPNLNDDFYDPQIHTFPPKEISQPPDLNESTFNSSYEYPPDGIRQPPNLEDDFYDPEIHIFPPEGLTFPNLSQTFNPDNLYPKAFGPPVFVTFITFGYRIIKDNDASFSLLDVNTSNQNAIISDVVDFISTNLNISTDLIDLSLNVPSLTLNVIVEQEGNLFDNISITNRITLFVVNKKYDIRDIIRGIMNDNTLQIDENYEKMEAEAIDNSNFQRENAIQFKHENKFLYYRTDPDTNFTLIKVKYLNPIINPIFNPSWNYVLNINDTREALFYRHPNNANPNSDWLFLFQQEEENTIVEISDLIDDTASTMDLSRIIIDDNKYSVFPNFLAQIRTSNNKIQYKTKYGLGLSKITLYFSGNLNNYVEDNSWNSTIINNQVQLQKNIPDTNYSDDWTTLITINDDIELIHCEEIYNGSNMELYFSNVYIHEVANYLNVTSQTSGEIFYFSRTGLRIFTLKLHFRNTLTDFLVNSNYDYSVDNNVITLTAKNNVYNTNLLTILNNIQNEIIFVSSVIDSNSNDVFSSNITINKSKMDYNNSNINVNNLIEIQQNNNITMCKTNNTNISSIQVHYENDLVSPVNLIQSWNTTINNNDILISGSEPIGSINANDFFNIISQTYNNTIINLSQVLDDNSNNISQSSILLNGISLNKQPEIAVKFRQHPTMPYIIQYQTNGAYLTCVKLMFDNEFPDGYIINNSFLPGGWSIIKSANKKDFILFGIPSINASSWTGLFDIGTSYQNYILTNVSDVVNHNAQLIPRENIIVNGASIYNVN